MRTKICVGKKLSDKNSIQTITQVLKQIEILLPRETARFINQKIKLHNRRGVKNGHRWTIKDNLFFLSIFYHSRKAYKLLRNIFMLPSRSTLLLLISNCSIFPGFHDNIFNSLKIKMKQIPTIECVLVFDEMKLRRELSYDRKRDVVEGFEDIGEYGKIIKSADYALCFMVKGITKVDFKQKWKLNVGYFLTPSTIKVELLYKLILSSIRRLLEIGLIVNINKCTNISIEKPFFTIDIYIQNILTKYIQNMSYLMHHIY